MTKLKAALFFSLFTLITACGGGSTESSVSDSSRILAFGDSFGTGFGGVNAWPDLIRSRTGLNIVNGSRGGRNAAFALQEAVILIEREQPTHILILLGTNDANRSDGVETATNAMREIVNFAIGVGVTPIVGTVPPRNARSRQISANYRGLGVQIAEIEAAFGTGAGLFQSDGIHPNNAGQDVIANTFISAL